MVDVEKIRSEGVKIIEEFSEKLGSIDETDETIYVTDIYNVRRPDEDSVDCEGFKEKLLKLAPKSEQGYIVAEKGK